MQYQIKCQTGTFPVPDLSDLGVFIEDLIGTTGDAAYWLHKNDEMIVGFLYNGEHATVFRWSDGAEPFSPDAPANQSTQIRLENGQLDDFDLQKCICYDDALAAFVQIANTGRLADNIEWLV